MKNSSATLLKTMVVIATLAALAVLAPFSSATAPLTITVENNSERQIRRFYVSPANSDDWGPDQLSEPISVGSSRTLNISWEQSTIKLVAEDQDGCFLYETVEAAGSLTWAISSNTSRDCGD